MGCQPPLKTIPPLFLTKPPLNLQTVQAPFLGNPPSILTFCELPLKIGLFGEPKNISFSLLTPSYPLNVIKFLIKIFRFEFLVMIEKNIVYQQFLPLNISDFS